MFQTPHSTYTVLPVLLFSHVMSMCCHHSGHHVRLPYNFVLHNLTHGFYSVIMATRVYRDLFEYINPTYQ